MFAIRNLTIRELPANQQQPGGQTSGSRKGRFVGCACRATSKAVSSDEEIRLGSSSAPALEIPDCAAALREATLGNPMQHNLGQEGSSGTQPSLECVSGLGMRRLWLLGALQGCRRKMWGCSESAICALGSDNCRSQLPWNVTLSPTKRATRHSACPVRDRDHVAKHPPHPSALMMKANAPLTAFFALRYLST